MRTGEFEHILLICLLIYASFVNNFQVAQNEILTLVNGFDNQQIFQGAGVTLAGQRYIYLSGTDRVVRAKQGKVGVHCMKTNQGINFISLNILN